MAAVAFMNSCSDPSTMPVYAVARMVTGTVAVTSVKRLRCAADRVDVGVPGAAPHAG